MLTACEEPADGQGQAASIPLLPAASYTFYCRPEGFCQVLPTPQTLMGTKEQQAIFVPIAKLALGAPEPREDAGQADPLAGCAGARAACLWQQAPGLGGPSEETFL